MSDHLHEDNRRLLVEQRLPGRSAAWRRLQRQVARAAGCALPALVRGESGCGKERVARSLHDLGPRRSRAFVTINCAALPETLLEAELFGAVRGAYTGCDRDRPGLLRQADRGTLFLDEIGEMTLAVQAKLLRVLDGAPLRAVGGNEERSVNVRFVAATHRDLEQRVAEGRFRADLWWRLAILRLDVPPLRARRDDLRGLVQRLAPELEQQCGRAPLGLTDDAWQRLENHDWPGNVRELRGVLARALIASDRLPIPATAIQLDGRPRDGLEATMIRTALHETAGTISAAARRIGWTRQKLYRRMDALGIQS